MSVVTELALHLTQRTACRLALVAIAAGISFLSCFAQSKAAVDGEFAKLLSKAGNGSSSAQDEVAKAYAQGRTGVVDYEEAARWYRRAADQGDPDSQNNLGVLYLFGRGVAKDGRQAEEWFQRSASSGFVLAQHNLATMYLKGWGVPRDVERGMEYLTRAATNGLSVSQLQLGTAYLYGQSVPSNPEMGLKFVKLAAKNHLPAADFILGLSYENGRGTKRDISKAFDHYRKAAEHGYAPAQNNLGRFYLTGKSIPKDTQEANRLFLESASQGNTQSYLNLAFCALKGCTGVIDATAAYGWYLSAKSTQQSILEIFDERFARIANELSPEQIKEAQTSSQTWIAQHPVADPQEPAEVAHVPGAAVAFNRPALTMSPQDEVMKRLWQQTHSMRQLSPTPASAR